MTVPGYFYLLSLGCPKNLVDSEWLSGRLMGLGGRPVTDPAKADVIIVNTCAFIATAAQESIDAILALRRAAPEARLVVTGCFPLRYGRTLKKLLPEVTTFFTSRRMERADEAVLREIFAGAPWVAHVPEPGAGIDRIDRVVSTPFYTAYVKIADGCNRRCAFCTLPAIRGRYRSRPMGEIAREVTVLAERGAREIILVAQDTAAYGRDLGDGTTLAALLRRLSEVPGVSWLKLLYLYPDVKRVTRDLVQVMTESPAVCPVVDVPVQHAAPGVLKGMRRPGPDAIRRVLDRLREVPGIRLRTTVMVGFPGETEEDFRCLLDFIGEQRFYSLGAFAYSDEEGTRAFNYPGKVPKAEKARRLEALMARQREIARRLNGEMVGEVLPVLIEGPHEETDLLLRGRTAFQFPEIDGCVIINEGTAKVGEIVPVRITEAGDYDLVGEVKPLRHGVTRGNMNQKNTDSPDTML